MDREWKVRNLITNVYAVVLFTSAGLYSWAIRGCAGYGGSMGCLFAGILWAVLWYWLSRDTPPNMKRPFGSVWILPAIFLGIGLSGMQGWMQWAHWIRGDFILNWDIQLIQPINPWYGVLWWFLVGIHWGGMGGVALAWTSPQKKLSKKDWGIRILFGAVGLGLAYLLFTLLPSVFLPHYAELDSYNIELYPSIARVIHDNRQAMMWLGLYIGFLIYESTQKNWRGVKIILITGVGTGVLWPIFQRFFWYFVPEMIFPTVPFNWWRVWESAAGGAIGLVYGVAYIILNKPRKIAKTTSEANTKSDANPKIHVENTAKTENRKRVEHLVAYITIWSGVILGMNNGLEGMNGIYGFTDVALNLVLIPLIPLGIIGLILLFRYHPKFKKSAYRYREIPYFPAILITAYMIHRLSIWFSTGPLTNPVELSFVLYYLILTGFDLALIFIRLKYQSLLKR